MSKVSTNKLGGYVGDPHIKVGNIEEAKKLWLFILDTAQMNNWDFVCLLGDLFHNHAVLRLEVIDFWTWAFRESIKRQILVIAMTGNHDMPGSIEKEHMSALTVYKYWNSPWLEIIDEPQIKLGIAFIPYRHEEAVVTAHAKRLFESGAQKCAVIHQTLDMSKYENGFYAKDSMDSGKFPQKNLIVGHIHTEQEFQTTGPHVWHPGTPKWDTLGDANKEKGIWSVEHLPDGEPIYATKKFYTTEHICQKITTHTITEGDTLPVFDENARNHVTLIGTSDWIKKTKKKLNKSVRVKSQPTDSLSSKLAPKERLVNIEEFIKSFDFTPGVDKDKVISFIKT